jgi:hypothetical protein
VARRRAGARLEDAQDVAAVALGSGAARKKIERRAVMKSTVSLRKESPMTKSARHRLFGALTAVVAAAAAFAAVATGSGDGRPATEPLTGTYRLAAVDVKTRTCIGTDGAYVEARGVLEGTSSSSDPRFNGRFQAVIERGFTNLTSGYGTSRGFVTWFDAAGNKTAEAAYREVITDASRATGIFFGRVFAAHGRPAGALFANYKAAFDAQLNATAEFGGAADARTPAVVQTGHCADDEEADD